MWMNKVYIKILLEGLAILKEKYDIVFADHQKSPKGKLLDGLIFKFKSSLFTNYADSCKFAT